MKESKKGSMAHNRNDVATVAAVVAAAPMTGILARFAPGCSRIPSPKSDAQRLSELFEERVAICQFDGGLTRAEAEVFARKDVNRAT